MEFLLTITMVAALVIVTVYYVRNPLQFKKFYNWLFAGAKARNRKRNQPAKPRAKK